jgi:Spy/CpxP family protein refolding chaperone
MDAAQKKLRDATRSLNETIYADQVNESEVEARIKDRQVAQAEVERLRFMTELAVRRILTPEQLIKFRELRERFEKLRDMSPRRQFSEHPFEHRRNKEVQPADPTKQN